MGGSHVNTSPPCVLSESRPSTADLTPSQVRSWNVELSRQPAEARLRWAWERFGTRAAIGTSFQGAGLVILHLAREHQLPFPVFTLDTGLLFPESVTLRTRLEQFFGITIEVLAPPLSVAQQSAIHGPELWKRDPDLCCTLRKVLPLQERLAGADCWITGLRREPGAARADLECVELYHHERSGDRDLVKLNPLASWTRERVWEYVARHRIPYNPLHDQGYHSIGCGPCTVPNGNPSNGRAGRWTGFAKTECGIHTFLPRKA